MQGFSYTLYLFIVFPVWFIAIITAILLERYLGTVEVLYFPLSNLMIHMASIATIVAQLQIAKAWVDKRKVIDPQIWNGFFSAWQDPYVKMAIYTWIACMAISMIFPPILFSIANYFCH